MKSYLLAATLVSGCATVTPIYAPDGKAAYLVECHGKIARCHATAAELCKGAYVPLAEKRAFAGEYELTARCAP